MNYVAIIEHSRFFVPSTARGVHLYLEFSFSRSGIMTDYSRDLRLNLHYLNRIRRQKCYILSIFILKQVHVDNLKWVWCNELKTVLVKARLVRFVDFSSDDLGNKLSYDDGKFIIEYNVFNRCQLTIISIHKILISCWVEVNFGHVIIEVCWLNNKENLRFWLIIKAFRLLGFNEDIFVDRILLNRIFIH